MFLNDYLSKNCQEKDLILVLKNLAKAAIQISKTIKKVKKNGTESAIFKTKNTDGDIQKPLDILSDEILVNFMKMSPVSAYASEEQEGYLNFKNKNNLIVFADPLDGSSNIDVNVSIGTIFSIMSKNNLPLDGAFSQEGKKQKSSGFFVYGPQTTLFITVGKGTALFALDESNKIFTLIDEKIIIPKTTSEFAINSAYKRFWDPRTSKYIQNCQEGDDGPRKKNFGMRWVGSLVADASRILIRGGIFLYPADRRIKYKEGRLRLTYEANPVAFLVEQAGGKAINGEDNILNVKVKNVHQRSPLIFGSSEEVLEFKNS